MPPVSRLNFISEPKSDIAERLSFVWTNSYQDVRFRNISRTQMDLNYLSNPIKIKNNLSPLIGGNTVRELKI